MKGKRTKKYGKNPQNRRKKSEKIKKRPTNQFESETGADDFPPLRWYWSVISIISYHICTILASVYIHN